MNDYLIFFLLIPWKNFWNLVFQALNASFVVRFIHDNMPQFLISSCFLRINICSKNRLCSSVFILEKFNRKIFKWLFKKVYTNFGSLERWLVSTTDKRIKISTWKIEITFLYVSHKWSYNGFKKKYEIIFFEN